MYDILMRLPLLLWVTFASIANLIGFIQHVHTAASLDPIKIAARLSLIAFLLLTAAMVILRSRPSGKADGLEPRISALIGTFLMYGITLFPRHELPLVAEIVATFFTIIGTIAAFVALCQLGRSFSIMAESRRLITSGPYRIVRHPLYVGEAIAMIGLYIQFASISTALIFLTQIAFQLRRAHNEEVVLSSAFPEYQVYRKNTACLIPGVY